MQLYGGIDPGTHGAIGLISEDMQVLGIDDLPTCSSKATGGYNPSALLRLLRSRCVPGIRVGVEWPQTRPGEGAQRSRNFGLGLGYVEMALIALGVDWERVDPAKWKHRLSLPGKGNTTERWRDARDMAVKLYDTLFPAYKQLIRGPRGGILLDRCEAVLVAEFLRQQTIGGIRATVDKYGPNSDQAWLMVFGGRPGRRKRTGPEI